VGHFEETLKVLRGKLETRQGEKDGLRNLKRRLVWPFKKKCQEEVPGRSAWKKCLEEVPGRSAWKKCLEEVPGRSAWKKCLEEVPGRGVGEVGEAEGEFGAFVVAGFCVSLSPVLHLRICVS
jgi:hypothetical protein